MTSVPEMKAKIAKLPVNLDRMDGIVNGPAAGPTSVVTVDSGQVKTLARVASEGASEAGTYARIAADNLDAGHVRQWRFRMGWSIPSPQDSGAAGTGVADDTDEVLTSVGEASQYPCDRVLLSGDYRVTSMGTQRARFQGPGRILVDYSAGGQWQFNTYADEGKAVVGRANLYAFQQRLRFPSTIAKIAMFGDSTFALSGPRLDANGDPADVSGLPAVSGGGGFAGLMGEPPRLLRNMLRYAGVSNPIEIVDLAVGSSKVDQASMAERLPGSESGGYVDLLIHKGGINDAGYVPGDFRASAVMYFAELSAQLAAVRALPRGAPSQLTIVLMMPNPTFGPEHGHTSVWYEMLRGGYENAARNYNCVVIDTYALERDMMWFRNAPTATDGYDANPVPIHPGINTQTRIIQYLAEVLVPPYLLSQINAPVGVGFVNGWENYGDPFAPLTFQRKHGGYVGVRGWIKGGNITAGQAFANIPWTAFDPEKMETIIGVNASNGFVAIRVNPLTHQLEWQDGNATSAYVGINGEYYAGLNG